MNKTSVLFFCTCLFISCEGSKADLDKEREILMETDRQFSQLSAREGRVKAFLRYMEESAAILPRAGHPVVGKEAFRRASSGLDIPEQKSLLTWEPYYVDISSSADLGYTLGRYKYTLQEAEGISEISYGYYVTMWKKQPDGSWKFAFDAGNQSPPPEDHP